MAKTDVTSMVDDLSVSMADATLAAAYYDDAVEDLGMREVLTRYAQFDVQVVVQQATYTLPTNALQLMAAIINNTHLYDTTKQELSATDPHWRDRDDEQPYAVLRDDDSSRDFTVYPKPRTVFLQTIGQLPGTIGELTGTIGELSGTPIQLIITEKRTDVPTWLELPLAFDVLAREFERESDHQDVEMAKTCRRMANLLYGMVL